MLRNKKQRLLFVLFVLGIGLSLRFFGLGWGSGWYFHPDENNMAQAVAGLGPSDLDPHFYAYGQFPLFLAYFSHLGISGNKAVGFPRAIFWLRLWSAVFSSLTLLVGYFFARFLFKKDQPALTYLLLLSFTPGLIQMAHFGTTESILTFILLGLAYFSCRIIDDKKPAWKRIFILSFLLGIGLASKVSAFLFLFPIGTIFLFKIFSEKKKIHWFFAGIVLLALSGLVFFLFSPFYLLNHAEAIRTVRYESGVASGKFLVFYTRQFISTPSIVFQLTKILPWTLGLPMFIFLLIGTVGYGLFLIRTCFVFVYVIWNRRFTNPGSLTARLFAKRKLLKINIGNPWLAVHLFWLTWFLFHGFLFVKWTRFMIPTLPFLVLFVVWFFYQLKLKFRRQTFLSAFIYAGLFLFIIPGLIFSKIYLEPDIRFQASRWLNANLPAGSVVLSETGNVVGLPLFNDRKLAVDNFDFYHLDENAADWKRLDKSLAGADYFLSGSRRVFANHLRLKREFPKTARFYQRLFSGESGFVLLKEFKVFNNWEEALLGSDLSSEETWTVFDHPTIRLYKRIEKNEK